MPETVTSHSQNNGSGQSVSFTAIISDSTAKWLLIALLSFAMGYAVVKAQSASDAAKHAQQEADLAKYYTIDMETYFYKQGFNPPKDPWTKKAMEIPKPKTNKTNRERTQK